MTEEIDKDKSRINVKQKLQTINSYASGHDGKGYDCFSDMGIDPETFSSLPLAKKQEMLRDLVGCAIVNVVRNDLDAWKSLLPWKDSEIHPIGIEMVLDEMIEAGLALLALRDLCFHYGVKLEIECA